MPADKPGWWEVQTSWPVPVGAKSGLSPGRSTDYTEADECPESLSVISGFQWLSDSILSPNSKSPFATSAPPPFGSRSTSRLEASPPGPAGEQDYLAVG